MDQIEVAARALCQLDGSNPDTLVYKPDDLKLNKNRTALGITMDLHLVRPGKNPTQMWEFYVPWVETVKAALKLHDSDGPSNNVRYLTSKMLRAGAEELRDARRTWWAKDSVPEELARDIYIAMEDARTS